MPVNLNEGVHMYQIGFVVVAAVILVGLAYAVQSITRIGTTKCPACRERMSSRASKCPHCGTSVPG